MCQNKFALRRSFHLVSATYVRHDLVVPVGERPLDGELERLGHGELVAGWAVLVPGAEKHQHFDTTFCFTLTVAHIRGSNCTG